MMKHRIARFTQFVLLAAVVLALPVAIPRRADAQTPAEPAKISIRITDSGWNGQGSKFSVTVEEGQAVELTFVWDHQVHVTDEHVFVLEGYGIETKPINSDHKQETLKFVADKPGNFRMKCDFDCEVHDQLKNGTLVVAKKGAGGAASGAPSGPPSKLTVAGPVSATVGQVSPLQVTAVDASGKPIAGGKVRLMETVSFLAAEPSEVEVARATTDKDGRATLSYAVRRTGDRELKVAIDGGAAYGPASIGVKIPVVSDEEGAYRVEPPPGIPGVNRFFVSGVLIVVWGTMFVVALHVVAIVRAGRPEADTGKGGRNG